MLAELAEGLRAKIRQFMVLPVPPHVLDAIELGCVAREILESDPPPPRGDVVTDDVAPVRGQAAPDDEQLAPEMALEAREKLDDLRSLDGSWEEPEIEAPPRYAGDRREQVRVEGVWQDLPMSELRQVR